MKTVFTPKRPVDLLHIETRGAVVNIRDYLNRQDEKGTNILVDSVEIFPSDGWKIEILDKSGEPTFLKHLHFCVIKGA